MKDPTRIPSVIEELRNAWEGQPDLSLATLFGILQNKGIGWGTEDTELVTALQEMQESNPARIATGINARYIVETTGPDARITIDPFRIAVRRLVPGGANTQPGVWKYSTIIRCEVGAPLVVADTEGIRHRMGIVTRLSLVNASPHEFVDDLTGYARDEMDDRVLLLEVDDDVIVLVDRHLTVFTATRRSLEQQRFTWHRLIQASPGVPLIIEQQRGGATITLGNLRCGYYLEG